MANALKGEAEVVLKDGRKLMLVFDVNAWIDIGEELGIELPEIIRRLSDKDNPAGLKFQRTVMWGGLRKHHPEMSMRDAGEVLVEAAAAMAAGLNGGLPQTPEAEPDDEEDETEAGGEATAGPPLIAVTGTNG